MRGLPARESLSAVAPPLSFVSKVFVVLVEACL